MGNRFEDALKTEHATKVIEGERKDESLSDPEEGICTGATPAEEALPRVTLLAQREKFSRA